MRLGQNPGGNQTLGARRLPMGNVSNDPRIATEGQNSGMNPFNNPFMNMASDPTMQNMAGDLIKGQVQKTASAYTDYLSFDIIRPYFKINNKYILSKLKLIFMPFLQKGDWKPVGAEDFMNSKYDINPMSVKNDDIDIFSVDLYLPIISLISLTLIYS